MTDHPALQLYNAWDIIYRANYRSWRAIEDGLTVIEDICNRPPQLSRYANYQLLDWKAGIQPLCLDTDGRPVYTFGYISGRRVSEPLLHLDADGRFSLGNAFGYSPTWGPFEKMDRFTFMGGGNLYGLPGKHLWFTGGRYSHLSARDWRKHHYYFRYRASYANHGIWFDLERTGTTWRTCITQEQDGYRDHHNQLTNDYREAEDYYAKWRRKYYKDNSIPDPETLLDPSSIETVDYLEQHLRVYEPAKARLLSQGGGRVPSA